MFTSYFGNLKNLPEGYYPVAITRGVPKWFKGRVDQRLAPTWAMLKGTQEQYVPKMKDILSRLDAKKIYEELGDKAVILCYEKPGDFCHRRMVAEWFEEELGITVPELGIDRKDTPHSLQTGETAIEKSQAPEQPAKQVSVEPPKMGKQSSFFSL